MEYLLQDLLKLPIEDRLVIIEKVITYSLNNAEYSEWREFIATILL